MAQKLTLAETARLVLSDAAIDVLQQSAKEGQQPQDHVHGETPENTLHDLGGATTENPAGNNIGAAAAALVGRARPPGVQPKPESDQPMTHLNNRQPASDEGMPTVEPTMATPSGNAPTEKDSEEAGNYLYTKEDAEANHQAIVDAIKSIPAQEDVAALFNGVELSEDVKSRIQAVFETAVIARAVKVVQMVEEQLVEASEEAIQEVKNELEEQVDAYLETIVEQWKTENEVAITSGLRTEISEEFIAGLRELFEAHDMDIPEDKINVVEELTTKVEELVDELNETMNTNIELRQQLAAGQQNKILSVACEGLTATQADKIKTLAEGVEFTTEGEYTEKLSVIREQYFPTKGGKKAVAKAMLIEDSTPDAVEGANLSPEMSQYVAAISITNPK